MTMRRALMSCLCLLAIFDAGAIDLSETELRGKQIFLTGTSPAGTPIAALLGVDRTELPASAAPCASCHGFNGRGRPEGGVVPSDITWGELSKSYGHDHQYGRRHPPFDEFSVAAAITQGVDSAGNKLDPAMPEFRMQQDDVTALIAYLKRLEEDVDPGVGEHSVRLATLLPEAGPAASQGAAIRALLIAWVQEINGRGGINGRRIDLTIIAIGTTPEQTLANVKNAFHAEGVFALLAPYASGIDTEVASLLKRREVPIIGPLASSTADRQNSGRSTFYLYSGTAQLMQSLAGFATRDAAADTRMVVTGFNREIVERVASSIHQGADAPDILAYAATGFSAPGLAAEMHTTDDVYFLGTATELDQLLRSLAGSGKRPRIFLPAAAASQALLKAPADFDGRIFIAYPTMPRDVNDKGRSAYAALGRLPAKHFSLQIASFAAATVLAEAMQRSGHDLSRERLIAELEHMRNFETGLAPPISFGLNRRVGALGAYVVTVDVADGRFVPAAGWRSRR